MTSYKPTDSKREEFRKYLDRSGVMDALTKALVKLYEEEERPGPDDAIGYLLKQLGGVKLEDYDSTLAKVLELQEQLASLQPESTSIKASSHESIVEEHAE